MGTEALIELYLMSAGWTRVGLSISRDAPALWDHEHVLAAKTTGEAQEITQQWEDLAFDDDGPEPEEDDCA
jgi:hypothetical protein